MAAERFWDLMIDALASYAGEPSDPPYAAQELG